MNQQLKMIRKGEKSSTAAAASVATASVVASRTLTSATATASPTPKHHTKDNNIPSHHYPKSHPKTLDIPSNASTPVKKLTGINGSSVVGGGSSNGGGGMVIPPRGDKRSGAPSVPPRLTGDNIASREKIQDQAQLQQKTSPGATANSGGSSSSSSPRSGINPSQFASICREVNLVRQEHIAIRKSLSEREGELGKTRVALRNIAQERDFLRNKVFELEQILKHSPELHSQVSALLTHSNGGMHASGNTNHGFQTSTNPIPTSSSPPASIPNYNNNTSKASSSSLPSSPPEKANSITNNVVGVSPAQTQSPRRNIQQNQKQTSSPLPTPSSLQQQRPDTVAIPGMLESPRKSIQNGNGNNNLKRGGGSNINCQDSHLVHQQHNHNNKNLQQIHSFQNQANMNNMNDKKCIYSHDMTPEQFQLQQGFVNGRNDCGNNNNNQLKNIATATAPLTRGDGGGQNNQHHLSQSGITGLDLMLLGPDCSTKVVEHLVHPVQVESSIREIQHTLVLKGVPMNGDRLREVEIEIDRLNSRIDHLRSQNDVLTLNLEDAKSHADRLTVLLGKYESNNVALQLALRYSDHTIEAYDTLLALLETELGQVLAHIHAAGKMQSICSGKSAASTSSTPTNQNSATPISNTQIVVSSRSSSGNNNNSNDNSPSEHVPPSVGQATPLETSGAPSLGINKKVDEGHEKFNGDKKHDDLGNNHPENGKIVPVMKNHHNNGQTEKITSPAMSLVEQARRNRMTAEKAARFLLSRFPQPTNNSSGMFLSPTESENNNGHLPVSPSSHRHHQESTSSIISSSESIASNLSNISGESCGQSCSISSDDENLREGKLAYMMPRETSAIITVEKDGNTNGEIMMRSSTGQSSISPTTSSTTFRAPTTLENPTYVCTSIVTSCLPLLGSPKSGNPAIASPPVEASIRSLIASLKAERDAIKQTVVMKLERESLESLTPSPNPTVIQLQHNASPTGGGQHSPNWTHAEARKLDLETAVLMQELMAMKEERAELRAQLFLVEKEKEALELRLGSHESQEEAYKARIKFLKTEILECKGLYTTTTEIQNHNDRNKNDLMITAQQQQQQQHQQNNGNFRNKDAIINNNNNSNNVNWERELLLKKRIHELAATLENVTTSSQIRERQHQEMISELNRANGTLMQTLEMAKKKYLNRIKKMEDQIVYISEKYATQLRFYGEKSGSATVTGRSLKTTMKSYG